MLQGEGDAYVTPHLLGFDSRARLERFVASFNQVIARHDILRTAVLWEGLSEPVQVVARNATLDIEWLPVAKDGSAAERLNAHVDPLHHRIDVRHAPMLRAVALEDVAQQRWLLQLPGHHLVLDHTTLELIVEEIALIQQDRADELPEPVPFRRFVAQARLGVSAAEHEAFFKKMLGDVEEPTAPFGLLDVQGDGGGIEESRLPLPAELSAGIRQQARRHGLGAASLFHLAWALVLSKATGKDDVVFGTVLFGRMQGGEGADRALGMFINTLPMRVKLAGRGVLQSLRETHTGLTDLLDHEHASLSLAQRCSGLPGGTPLFSALLNYRYNVAKDAGMVNAGFEGMVSMGGEERTNYPLTMAVDDLGQGFQLEGQAGRAVGAGRLCDYMLAAVTGIVEALAAQSERDITGLSLLGDAERERLNAWGVNATRYSDQTPVHAVIEHQAKVRPHATALQFGDESLNYAELNRRANQLAHHLIALGVRRDARIGIALERSFEMVIGLLAILKAGAAYVPMDPEYPADRLAYMLEDSGIELLLTQSAVNDALPKTAGLRVLELDKLDLAGQPGHNPQVAVHPENLAYVIYTSGSTGRPKGVMVRHGALRHFMSSMAVEPGMVAGDILVAVTSLSFDIAALEIYLPLMQGARVVIASRDVARDGEALARLIGQSGASVLQCTPASWRMLLAGGWRGVPDRPFKGLCGGEALQPDLAAELAGVCVELWNMYGPTETTIWSSAGPASRGLGIGHAIADTRLLVLDPTLQPAPIGVAGELCLGGVGLARGYLGRAALSAERFVADPLGVDGERLYRTGDLARWNANGQLEYLGRLDHQVKIRGFRIELGEIETQLLAQPEVGEAVVVALEGPAGTRLVGYVAMTAGQAPDVAELRERLGRALPDYMVPAAIVVLDRLPLNVNGKVDRRALPQPGLAGEAAYEAPQGAAEEALAAVWAEVLGVARVGRRDNFFELGGDSVSALRVLALARSRLTKGPRFTLQALMSQPTIESLSQPANPVTLLNQAVEGKAPLFCIHPGLGTVLGYLPLARKLSGTRAVYGVACRTLNDASHRDASLHQMADDYVDLLRAVQPTGPYYVLGWSLGGALAALMAARLEQLGQRVEFLGMIDPTVPTAHAGRMAGAGADWRTMYGRLLRDVTGGAENVTAPPEHIADPLADEQPLIEWTGALLRQHRASVVARYREISAEELVRIFVVDCRLTEAALASVRPLPALAAGAHCWWADDQLPEAVEQLNRQLGEGRVANHRIDADHGAVVAHPAVLAEVADLLR
jgi:amino acid adenylation domain-containing protein